MCQMKTRNTTVISDDQETFQEFESGGIRKGQEIGGLRNRNHKVHIIHRKKQFLAHCYSPPLKMLKMPQVPNRKGLENATCA